MNKNILIVNNGQAIKETNYFDSDQSKSGLFYLSWNAGAARLLLPKHDTVTLNEIKTADFVVITRGKLNGRDAFELFFEDHSETPFCVHMESAMSDRNLPKSDHNRALDFFALTANGETVKMRGVYRVGTTLPAHANSEDVKIEKITLGISV